MSCTLIGLLVDALCMGIMYICSSAQRVTEQTSKNAGRLHSAAGGCTVYQQSDRSLAIVDIDASKGFVDLWVHLFVAIEDIHRNGYRLKVHF